MKSPVTAHDALVQSPYFDRERPVLAATCIATLIGRLSRQHDIAVYRLHRCLRQITTLKGWQEGPCKAPVAMGIAMGSASPGSTAPGPATAVTGPSIPTLRGKV